MDKQKNPYSAEGPALGYMYQSRFALFKLLNLQENTKLLIEKDDDLEFQDDQGIKSLSSLKHKKKEGQLTNLSIDFWKSVRIWLNYYNNNGQEDSNVKFFIFTTEKISPHSFLNRFIPEKTNNDGDLLTLIQNELDKTNNKIIIPIREELYKFNENQKKDFFDRILILDESLRIEDIPKRIINDHMRPIRPEHRPFIYERLEGWWNNRIIKSLLCENDEIRGQEVSDKMAEISDEYKTESLPIEFSDTVPAGNIDPNNDSRLFVMQLKEIGISSDRIKHAIVDYYRAFQQRSSWARQYVLIDGEIEKYESRLVEEWERTKAVVFEDFKNDSSEEKMRALGEKLYRWATMDADIRIRKFVSEPYVIRGNFQILANNEPQPRVYWHPQFLERLEVILSKGLK